ncbi:MAG: dTDP-4-dehydrorhamnose reductase [Salinivirgaceae bacterium]|nr:dTDP-4-dehydrorhamnose reductase [Salinivirgaceae bacterium]
MKCKIVVTGANGQLGNAIQELANNYPNFEFIYTDVQDLDITNKEVTVQFISTVNPQAIINCAAYTAVDKAEENQSVAEKINVVGIENLAIAAKNINAYLLHVSTDFVFDGKSSIPYIETDLPDPKSVYGTTKWKGEQALLNSQTRYAIVRTSWLYSVGNANFLNTMMKLGAEKSQLSVVFDQVGTPTAAPDLANVLLQMTYKTLIEKNDITGIYHFSNEGVCSWYDFAVRIMKIAKLPCNINPIHATEYPLPAKRPSFSVLDKTKIKEVLGIKIPHWEESLELVIKNKLSV